VKREFNSLLPLSAPLKDGLKIAQAICFPLVQKASGIPNRLELPFRSSRKQNETKI